MRGAKRGSVKTRAPTDNQRARNRARLMGARAAFRNRPLPAVGLNSTSVFQPPAGKEKKFIDVGTSNLILAGQATFTTPAAINLMAQGVDAVTHVGRQVTMTSLYWQFTGSLAATSTGTSPIRLMIVYDKEANGALATTAMILAQDQLNGANNLNNRDRFITLVDEVIESMTLGGDGSFFRKGFKKISLPVTFNATATATIDAINTGSVLIMACQSGNIITANPIGSCLTRIRFTDN